MVGLIAALIAVYLGAAGPVFRWKGAGLLAAAAVAIGGLNTALSAHDAASRGLQFVSTPGTVLLGLALQAGFMLTFYGLAAVAGWSARRLTAARLMSVQAARDGQLDVAADG